MRRFDCTSPPRWLMPCTSACLMCSSSSRAASSDDGGDREDALASYAREYDIAFHKRFGFFAALCLRLQGLDTFSARDDDRDAPVVDLLAQSRRFISSHVLGQGHDHAHMGGIDAHVRGRWLPDLPVPAESCPPVMAVVRLSEMMTVMSARSNSRRPAGRSCPNG